MGTTNEFTRSPERPASMVPHGVRPTPVRSVEKLPQASSRVPLGQSAEHGLATPAAFPPQGAAGTPFKRPNGRPPAIVSPRAHPLVRELFRLMKRKQLSAEKLARKSGYLAQTICKWRHGQRRPQLAALVDCLNALGYELHISPISPPENSARITEHRGPGTLSRTA